MPDTPPTDGSRAIQIALGVLSALALVGYGLAYLVAMPAVSPGAFVPGATSPQDLPSWFGIAQTACIVVFALSLLPVAVLATIRAYPANPAAIILAGCLLVLALLFELINALPLLALQTYPVRLAPVSPDVALHLAQVAAVRFLAFDVAGFSLLYAGSAVLAAVFRRTHRWFLVAVVVSIVLFVANVPCLWVAPTMAVVLMVLSIWTGVAVPVMLVRLASSSK